MITCFCQKIHRAALLVALLAGWAALSGCQTGPSNPQHNAASPNQTSSAETSAPAASATDTNTFILHEGDILHVTFPGAPSLDDSVTIRRDGNISIKTAGDVKAAGLTTTQLEKAILDKMGDQLADKEVSVAVQTSAFELFVTGAVVKPGKIVSDREETPLEAVIEAGIIHEKANLKKVVVIRNEPGGKTERFTLDLDKVIKKGDSSHPFRLKSMDTIYVPEKFVWY